MGKYCEQVWAISVIWHFVCKISDSTYLRTERQVQHIIHNTFSTARSKRQEAVREHDMRVFNFYFFWKLVFTLTCSCKIRIAWFTLTKIVSRCIYTNTMQSTNCTVNTFIIICWQNNSFIKTYFFHEKEFSRLPQRAKCKIFIFNH